MSKNPSNIIFVQFLSYWKSKNRLIQRKFCMNIFFVSSRVKSYPMII